MTDRATQTTKKQKIAKAQQSVIRAAKAWVNYEDDGMAETIYIQPTLNLRLANAVTRLEKLEGK